MEREAEPVPRRRGLRPRRPAARSTSRAARARTRSGSRSSAGGVPGVDFSEVAIAKARERAAREAQAVEFVCEDLVDYEPGRGGVRPRRRPLPAASRRTSGGSCSNERQRAVAPGGTFVLVGHDLTNLTEGVGGPSDPSILVHAGRHRRRAAGPRDREGRARAAATSTARTGPRSTRSSSAPPRGA